MGSAVALLLMGCAGWYLFSEWSANQKSQQELEETYSQLDQLTKKNPSPGTQGGKVDNQKIAEDQMKQLVEINRKMRGHFATIPPIPNSTNVTGRDFATTLPGTLASLGAAAAAVSVELPPQFAFSFAAQVPLNNFAAGSLQPLSVQLGEVKAICEILFASKINLLASIRRERISADDERGSTENYLEEKSTVTDMATKSPYEITFNCFSTELVSVLAGFANSPYCFNVRSVAVEPATATAMNIGYGTPLGMDTPMARDPRLYGSASPAVPAISPAATTRGGSVTFLDEKQIRVTLMLDIVKLKQKQ